MVVICLSYFENGQSFYVFGSGHGSLDWRISETHTAPEAPQLNKCLETRGVDYYHCSDLLFATPLNFVVRLLGKSPRQIHWVDFLRTLKKSGITDGMGYQPWREFRANTAAFDEAPSGAYPLVSFTTYSTDR